MNPVQKIYLFFIGLLLASGAVLSTASADILVGSPVVGGRPPSTTVEIGATFRITVTYRNDMGAPVTIDAALFEIEYLDTVVDETGTHEPTISSDPSAAGLPDAAISIDRTNNRFHYERNAGLNGSGITVGNGATVNLFTIQFHVRKNPDAGVAAPVEILNFRTPYPTWAWVRQGGVNMAGTVNDYPAIAIAASADPTFAGLDLAAAPVPGIASGSTTIANVGNTVTLRWLTNGGAASDVGGGAETRFADDRLRYNVFRNTVSDFAPLADATSLASETLGAPLYVFQDGPGTGVPAGANPLSDGTEYFYLVTAVDDTDDNAPGLNRNELGDAAGEMQTVRSITPHDYVAPPPPAGVTTTPANEQVTLNWTNPGGDFGGTIIVRKNDAGAVGVSPEDVLAFTPVSASDNGDGTEYTVGVAPGDADAQIIFVGGPANTTFTDTGRTNGQTYIYWLVSFDRVVAAAPGVAREQGRNYSAFARVAGTPGIATDPLQNFRALTGPGEGQIQLIWANPPQDFYGGARIVWTNDLGEWGGLNINNPTANDTNEPATERILGNLNTNAVYYFRGFAYNQSPAVESRQYSAGREAVAIPAQPGGGPAAGRISNLILTNVDAENNVATLQWGVLLDGNGVEVPGDYVIRSAGLPIVEANAVEGQSFGWDDVANVVNILPTEENPIQIPAAGLRSIRVALPPTGIRVFAVRHRDVNGILSPLSNLASFIAGVGVAQQGQSIFGSVALDLDASITNPPTTFTWRVEGGAQADILASNAMGDTPVAINESPILANNEGVYSFVVAAPFPGDDVTTRFFRINPLGARAGVFRHTLRRPEGRFGVNTFTNLLVLTNMTPAINNLADFVTYINRFDPDGNAVTAVHWWDPVEQIRRGFLVRYGENNVMSFEPTAGVDPAQLQLQRGAAVQVNVARPVTFILGGEL